MCGSEILAESRKGGWSCVWKGFAFVFGMGGVSRGFRTGGLRAWFLLREGVIWLEGRRLEGGRVERG